MLIKTRALGAGYNGRPALAAVDLDLAPGSWLGIIGPNGAGKTTLLRVLSRYLPASAGTVYLDDRNLTELPPGDLARRLAQAGVATQSTNDLTVTELVLLGRLPHLKRWQQEGPRDWAVVEQALAATGIKHLAQRPLAELSAGERQRAFFACALAQEPEILLLDEPTAHLDIHQQLQVMELLADLQRNRRLTLISVLHDLNLAALYCDRLLLLRDGRVQARGTPWQVLTPAHIRQAYNCPVAIARHPSRDVPQVTLLPDQGREPVDKGRING